MKQARVMTIPAIMQVRNVAPAAAAILPWWSVSGKTCVAAYQPKGAASLAASYVNLANPGTYDAAPGTAPTLTADGWQFDAASSQYLSTNIVISSGAWTGIVAFSGAATGSNENGLFGNQGRFDVHSNWYNLGVRYRNGNTSNAVISASMTSGVLALTKGHGYRNGVSDVTLTADGATNGNALLIGKADNSFGSSKIKAFAIYSATLTAGEVATISAAMAAL